MSHFIKSFHEINKDTVQECGGKACHLGELTNLKFNVPRGFCVVAEAFRYYTRSNLLEEQILEISKNINYEDFQDLEQKTNKIRSLIEDAKMPSEIERIIVTNYLSLSEYEKVSFVAVRSSVAVKDSQISSFPGMMDTYHYIRGKDEVMNCVKRCWASLWSERAAFLRNRQGIDHPKAIIAPIIQLMVNSEIAGVLFTANPITGSPGDIIVEANWGLGESVVSGKAVSDLYVVSKEKLSIIEKRIARKETMFHKAKEGGGIWIDVEPDKINKPTLANNQLRELCEIALTIEKHYGCPQDIEWAYEKNDLYILQARRAKL